MEYPALNGIGRFGLIGNCTFMGFFGRKKPVIQPGDLYVKVGDPPSKVWEVTKVWSTVDGIPHARLHGFFQQSESRIVAINVLGDRDFYIPTEPPPTEPVCTHHPIKLTAFFSMASLTSI